jgi:hypothetical protein
MKAERKNRTTNRTKRKPDYAHVMERINRQIVDLREIFSKQHYVHPDFRGSTSIKAVLPVLCPELSYEGFAIKEGATASEQWWEMVSDGSAHKRREIADALREYCKLDTYAMHAIWRFLRAACRISQRMADGSSACGTELDMIA